MIVSTEKKLCVFGCGAEMIDAIENSGLNILMYGEGLACVDYEDLEEFVNDLNSTAIHQSKSLTFIHDSLIAINNKISPEDRHGDVVYVK